MTLKKYTWLLCTFVSGLIYAQDYQFYEVRSENLVGFEYMDKYYEANPKGMMKFIEENEMPETLRQDLTAQVDRIRTKRTLSDITFWGGLAAGAGIMINEAVTVEEGEQMSTGTLFTGLGVFAASGLVNWLFIKPKRKDYYNFVNTFNEQVEKNKIKIGFKLNWDQGPNYGLVISF